MSQIPANDFPPGPSQERNDYLLNAVKNGDAVFTFVPLAYMVDGQLVELEIMATCMSVDGVFWGGTAFLHQQIADLLDCSLLTSMVADLLWANRSWTCTPHLMTPDNQMSSTPRMIEQTKQVEKELLSIGYDSSGIVQTMGKHWILHPGISPAKACNYGWHFKGSTSVAYPPDTSLTGPGIRVWQPAGLAHNIQHEDYSQTCTLVRQEMKIGGKPYRFRDVVQDPALCKFVSKKGVLLPRQPGVPELDPLPGKISSVPPSEPTPEVPPTIPPEAIPTEPNESETKITDRKMVTRGKSNQSTGLWSHRGPQSLIASFLLLVAAVIARASGCWDSVPSP